MTGPGALIRQTISECRKLEKLRGGGIGVVYKTGDSRLERLVALNFLLDDLVYDRMEGMLWGEISCAACEMF